MVAFTAVRPSKFGNGAKYNPKKPSWLPLLLISFYATKKFLIRKHLLLIFLDLLLQQIWTLRRNATNTADVRRETFPALFNEETWRLSHNRTWQIVWRFVLNPSRNFSQEVDILSNTTQKTYFTSIVSTLSKDQHFRLVV